MDLDRIAEDAHNDHMLAPRFNHSTCPHEATKAARLTCRKARAERTAMTTCPNHPTLAQGTPIPLRGEEGEQFPTCGCWRSSTDAPFKRHSFRFFAGDRVQWGKFAGVTGTVADYSRDCSRPSITWDSHCKDWAPTSRPSNFDIRHIGEGA